MISFGEPFQNKRERLWKDPVKSRGIRTPIGKRVVVVNSSHGPGDFALLEGYCSIEILDFVARPKPYPFVQICPT